MSYSCDVALMCTYTKLFWVLTEDVIKVMDAEKLPSGDTAEESPVLCFNLIFELQLSKSRYFAAKSVFIWMERDIASLLAYVFQLHEVIMFVILSRTTRKFGDFKKIAKLKWRETNITCHKHNMKWKLSEPVDNQGRINDFITTECITTSQVQEQVNSGVNFGDVHADLKLSFSCNKVYE